MTSEQVISPLKALISRHCATLVESVDALGTIVLSLPNAGDPQRQIAEGRALAHQITGSSGSIGFDEISALAAGVESKLLDLQRPDQLGDHTSLVEVAALYRKLESAAQATSPEHSRLYDADLDKLGRVQI